MFGLGKGKMKQASQTLGSCLSRVDLLRGNSYDTFVEKEFCSYVFGDPSGALLNAIGGDYEGSFLVSYHELGRITVEVYFSTRRGLEVYGALVQALQRYAGGCSGRDITRYVPGERATTFSVWQDGVSEGNLAANATRLLDIACAILKSL